MKKLLSSPSRLHREAAVKLALSLVLLAAAVPLCAQTADKQSVMPQSAEKWKQAALTDIQAGYQLTVDNHPGTYDPHNRDFLKNLKLAREYGLGLAAQVTDGAGYVAALQGFNVRIRDGHAGMGASFDPSLIRPERWPGFVTVWRGDALYVYASEAGGPAVGAEVVACDGKPIKELIGTNVFAFRGIVDQPGHWWVTARQVFVDRGNPFIQLPQHCQFNVDGKMLEQDLLWRDSTNQTQRWREESYNGAHLDVGITEPKAGLFWVAMPSFQPDEKQRNVYRAMYKELADNRQRYLDADAIIIDLRENQGGSSMWSLDFASALWGKDRVARRMQAYSAKTQVWWRASKDNTKYVTKLVDILTKQKQLEGVQWARQKSAGMRAALTRGDKFFIDKAGANTPPVSDVDLDLASDPAAFSKPVYVVVPGQCASACLDALDVFTRFPNTKLIGAPSSADSTYMEVRLHKLNSGLAQVIIPNKVYVNRARANGQFYTPAIYVNDLVWSTENLLKVVEKDLDEQKKRAAALSPSSPMPSANSGGQALQHPVTP